MAKGTEDARSAMVMVSRVRTSDLRPSVLVERALARAAGIEGLNAFVLLDHAGERVDPPWPRKINDTWLEIRGVTLAAAWGGSLPAFRDRMDPNVVALIEGARDMHAIDFKRIENYRTQPWHELRAILAEHDALLTPTC